MEGKKPEEGLESIKKEMHCKTNGAGRDERVR